MAEHLDEERHNASDQKVCVTPEIQISNVVADGQKRVANNSEFVKS